MEALINIEGTPYKTEVIENRKTWGNGATFKVYDNSGSILYKFDVVAHPEFDEYEKYQSMPLAGISREVATRIESGQYIEALKKSEIDGIPVMFLLNPNKNETHNN
jgi:hypothetical protein